MYLYRFRIGVLCAVAILVPPLMFGQMGQPGQMPTPTPPTGQMPEGLPGQGPGMAGSTNGSDPNSQIQAMKDKAFLHDAGQGGMAEVQLGQLASQKAASDEVKQFGQKMVADHTALNEEMKPIADKMGVRSATKLSKKDQAEYDKLNGLSGDEFDKEYLAYMVKDHHKDLQTFHTEASSVTDADLRAAVEKGMQVISQHTQIVDRLAAEKGVPVPERKG